MSIIRYFLLLLLFNNARTGIAQTISTLPAKTNGSGVFLYEVKLIDEFIERFNDDPDSYIRQQCRSLYGTDSMITRRNMLQTLFDKKQTWNHDTAQFFQQVNDAMSPQHISFTDSSWYAQAYCVFGYGTQKVEIPVVLHVKTVNGGSEWMIAGIGNCDLLKDGKPSPGSKTDIRAASGDFMPTSSHGTNFVVFNYVFSDKMHPADYFEAQLLATPKAQYFIGLVKEHKITFQYVKKISYHFFQLDNWVFTVEHFTRKEANSGWLISNLQKTTTSEKEAMLRKLLSF